MRKNFWLWAVGAGAVLWFMNRNKAEAQDRKTGNLQVSITWKPGTNTLAAVNKGLNALSALRSCGGPENTGAIQAPAVSGNIVGTTLNAVWTHDNMGPIKESVRVCMLKALQVADANIVDFQASRVS